MRTIIEHIRENFEVPAGYDQLYVRSVEPGRANEYGFEWPRTPGSTVTAKPEDVITANPNGCPRGTGDGFCLATSHSEMASGEFTARTLLVVAVRNADILGSENHGDKIRVKHTVVVACVNGSKLVRRHGAGLALNGADLRGANLAGAKLSGAKLSGADLEAAYLAGADLTDADLTDADLGVAYLTGADLTGADLTGADLTDTIL